MKKRITLFLLCLLLLLSACGTEPSSETEARSFFYYPLENSAQEVLFPAPSPADPAQLSPEAFLKAYLETAKPENALPILPEVWRFDSFSMEGSAACLQFTGEKTSPLRRSLSLACLTKTLLQHPLIRSVSVLSPESEQPTILTENDILLKDTGMEPQQAQITLYFPDGHISLKTIARDRGYNYQYLSRTFNKIVGINFKRLVNQYRMEYAFAKLQDTNLPLSQIAFESGFQSIRSFDHVCRSVYNKSPMELRRNQKSKVD